MKIYYIHFSHISLRYYVHNNTKTHEGVVIPIEFPPSPIRLIYNCRICAYDFWYIFHAFRSIQPPFM